MPLLMPSSVSQQGPPTLISPCPGHGGNEETLRCGYLDTEAEPCAAGSESWCPGWGGVESASALRMDMCECVSVDVRACVHMTMQVGACTCQCNCVSV